MSNELEQLEQEFYCNLDGNLKHLIGAYFRKAFAMGYDEGKNQKKPKGRVQVHVKGYCVLDMSIWSLIEIWLYSGKFIYPFPISPDRVAIDGVEIPKSLEMEDET